VRRRHGFTLVEIIVALALMLIVTGAIYRLLNVTQRLSQAQAAQLNLQSNLRTAALVAVNELRGLSTVSGGSPAQNDILSLTSGGLTYRAGRGTGFLCQAVAAGQLRIARSSFFGYRDPQPTRDTAYLFLEGSPDTETDDSWVPLVITDVTTGSACPGALGPAITITALPPAGSLDAPAGTPVRIYEVMELKLYQSDRQWWLGARSVSGGEAIQPLAGPLAGSDGFRLEYLDGSGGGTTDPMAVASIQITVRGRSDDTRLTGNADAAEDTLTTQVALRNVVRR
jgi:prepilin-type N-terminal cleavage/methylation domain-containing protein